LVDRLDAVVIRHVPEGRGHPYLLEPDQRVPLRPVVGEDVELRVTTAGSATAVDVELEVGGQVRVVSATRRGEAVPDVLADWGMPAPRVEEGHLSDAVARLGAQDGRTSWSVLLPPLAAQERIRYRFLSDGRRSRWFDLVGGQWSSDGGTLRLEADDDAAGARLVPGSVEWLVADGRAYRLRFALRLDAGERVVGFGERFDGLDQRGRLVDVAVFDQYKGQGARTYLPMPFAIVVGGLFGFHLESGRRARFDVGATDPDRIAVEVDLEPGEAEPQLLLRLFAGEPATVLDRFLDATGRPEAPPPNWIYRLWMSGNEWNTQERVLGEVRRSEREGIPVGAIVIEAWSDEQTFVAWNGAEYEPHRDGAPHRLADFTFPADGPWPDPKAMIDELHERGTRVLLWQIPLVESTHGQAGFDRQAMVTNGYCVMRADGKPYRNRGWWFPDALLPDFISADVRRWWTEKRRYLVEEMGVDGFKTDGGEHAWGTDLRYADGTHGGETNNRYPVLYGLAYHELMRSAGREPVTFSRAGFTGSASLPCHWAGDEDSSWEAFRASISAGLSAGACGITFWTWDLAGFSGPVPSPELYLRSAAAACFAPLMQYHSEYNHHRTPSRDRTPWNVAEQTGDSTVVTLFRRFVRLRERLVDYLAEQGERAVASGKPLMRALFFDVADDDRIWDFPQQYLLGDDLLVAPVTAPGVTTQRVFLPPGAWVDAWTGERFLGPDVIERDAPLDRIPAFITAARAETLLPCFADLDDGEIAHPPERLEVI
jgi:alpha-glucosidase (family GH31 glycosyl hydrolase)